MIAVFGGGLDNQGSGGPSPTLRDTAVTLRVQFRDPDGAAVNVVNPVARITREGVARILDAIGVAPDEALNYPLTADGANGLYKITFLTTGLEPGLYRATFEGTWTDANLVDHLLRVEGDIGFGEISRRQDWIRRVEQLLMDDVSSLYRLDEPVRYWSDDQIYGYLREAIDRVNLFPPRLTDFDFQSLPNDHLAIQGARVYALQARARLEKANEMSYSDGHTLTLQRADFYKQLADTLYQQWQDAAVAYKTMTPPTPIGLKGQQIPFRVSRILGLLPNFRTLFS